MAPCTVRFVTFKSWTHLHNVTLSWLMKNPTGKQIHQICKLAEKHIIQEITYIFLKMPQTTKIFYQGAEIWGKTECFRLKFSVIFYYQYYNFNLIVPVTSNFVLSTKAFLDNTEKCIYFLDYFELLSKRWSQSSNDIVSINKYQRLPFLKKVPFDVISYFN